MPERDVEAALLKLLPASGIQDLLDLGTGTGRMLELLGPKVERARRRPVARCLPSPIRTWSAPACGTVRSADRTCTSCRCRPLRSTRFWSIRRDYAEEPAQPEAARVLRPGGHLVIVDFARHDHESLRTEHAHRRLGFGDEEIAGWLHAAGMTPDRSSTCRATR